MLPEAEPVPLRPGAGVLALEVEGEVVARLRRWIADDGRSVRIWPDDPASSDTCAPSVLLGQDSTVDQIDAWFEHRRLDDLDLPIAHATLTPSAPAQWHHAPPPGPEGAIVDGLAVLLARSIASVTPQIADDSAVLQLPGVLDGAAPTDLVQRSWHARHGGTLLRLPERPPLRPEEADRIRARSGSRARRTARTGHDAACGDAADGEAPGGRDVRLTERTPRSSQYVDQTLRSRTFCTRWRPSLRSTRSARPRVGSTFSERFGPLIVRQIRSAVSRASSSVSSA